LPGDADGAGEDELDFVGCAPSDNGKTREATIATARAVLDFIVLGWWNRESVPEICGGKGIRTPDLLIANETLYQLSYTPKIGGKIITSIPIFIKHCPVEFGMP
jgi:hypothetical protein